MDYRLKLYIHTCIGILCYLKCSCFSGLMDSYTVEFFQPSQFIVELWVTQIIHSFSLQQKTPSQSQQQSSNNNHIPSTAITKQLHNNDNNELERALNTHLEQYTKQSLYCTDVFSVKDNYNMLQLYLCFSWEARTRS